MNLYQGFSGQAGFAPSLHWDTFATIFKSLIEPCPLFLWPPLLVTPSPSLQCHLESYLSYWMLTIIHLVSLLQSSTMDPVCCHHCMRGRSGGHILPSLLWLGTLLTSLYQVAFGSSQRVGKFFLIGCSSEFFIKYMLHLTDPGSRYFMERSRKFRYLE